MSEPARRELPRYRLALGVLAVWVLLAALLQGRDTLATGAASLTDLHRAANDVARGIGSERGSSVLFTWFLDPLRAGIDGAVEGLRLLLSQPAGGRPVPVLGWLGVAALATWLAAVFGGRRAAALTAGGALLLAAQGVWTEAMDTLALTLAAVVASLLVGVPLGVAAGLSPRVSRVVTPVLDLMQTMPTVVYLAPLTLLFLIGPASATIATLVYATPPVVRLTAHGVRSVDPVALEAATSLGATRGQLLRTVTLPLARRSIVLGINQTTMAALSMATVAALIDAPGLGQSVIKALQVLDVGRAFNAGLAIVVLAVVLDRVTTAASTRATVLRRSSPQQRRWRRLGLLAGGLAALAAVALSRTYLWAAVPQDTGLGRAIGGAADAVTAAVQDRFGGFTAGLKDVVTLRLLDPVEALLAGSPWWLVAVALVLLAGLMGSLRAGLVAAVCVVLLLGLGVWNLAMQTLAATLLATATVVLLGVVVGVLLGRCPRVDALVRPVLDAGQTMPPFVYLVPFLALFGVSRFTAIVAAVVYAAPVAVKIVADGVRAVPVAAVESATAVGSTRWQVVRHVQLPLSRRSLALATNQGLLHVLAMVAVGGLVGAGALGYAVLAGFSQSELFGKGLAAGLAIVLLGVLLDRTTHAAATREGTRFAPPEARPRRRPARGITRSAAVRRLRRRGSTRAPAHLALTPRGGRPRGRARLRGGPGADRLRRGHDRGGLRRSVRQRVERVRDAVRERRPRDLALGRLRGQRRGGRGDR